MLLNLLLENIKDYLKYEPWFTEAAANSLLQGGGNFKIISLLTNQKVDITAIIVKVCELCANDAKQMRVLVKNRRLVDLIINNINAYPWFIRTIVDFISEYLPIKNLDEELRSINPVNLFILYHYLCYHDKKACIILIKHDLNYSPKT